MHRSRRRHRTKLKLITDGSVITNVLSDKRFRSLHYMEVPMVIRLALLIAVALIFGCSGPTFTNLGNGVGVPTESIDSYARAKGVSRNEARQRMLDESNQKRQADVPK